MSLIRRGFLHKRQRLPNRLKELESALGSGFLSAPVLRRSFGLAGGLAAVRDLRRFPRLGGRHRVIDNPSLCPMRTGVTIGYRWVDIPWRGIPWAKVSGRARAVSDFGIGDVGRRDTLGAMGHENVEHKGPGCRFSHAFKKRFWNHCRPSARYGALFRPGRLPFVRPQG